MATLEDAAEELVVKLRGLEAEITESDQKLEALRERMEAAKRDVEEDWTGLTEAARSLLDTMREEAERLDHQFQETLQAVTDAHNAVAESAAHVLSEAGAASGGLDALGQQVAALEPVVESLVAEGIEAPARSLEDRAGELQKQLGQLVDEACTFLTEEVVPAIVQAAEDVRERGEELHRTLVEDRAEPLQQLFDEWSGHLDEVETYVLEQGYATSRRHAQDVVEYALHECDTASRHHLEELTQVVGLLEAQLQQFAAGMESTGRDLTQESGHRLLRELDEARQAADRAVSGLDRVRQELAARSFMEA